MISKLISNCFVSPDQIRDRDDKVEATTRWKQRRGRRDDEVESSYKEVEGTTGYLRQGG